ncbi:GNAT family N-acetyltransferase [Serinicoccus hydrothermalis]|uniref:GNAT family N-acetyltransferase n=1 Tax=Serinicoccus hydrothermalis TaxID=1758689 RepID=UPI0008309254|nr:GNAT family N-acetyltransferase [Serinicoccus hydrothermalis]
MPTLGEAAQGVRVRALTDDEALLLGALHKQALVRAGTDPDAGEPMHVRAFASAWHPRADDLPAWVAEHDGEHVGVAVVRRTMLPHLAGAPRLLVLSALGPADTVGEEAVCLALVRQVIGWARERGDERVEVAGDVALPAPVLDAVRAVVRQATSVSLPTQP